MSQIPDQYTRYMISKTVSKHSLLFSNVPGPTAPLFLAGEKVLGVHAIFPYVLPACMIISYGGGVFVTIRADSDTFDDEPMLRQCLVDELKELATLLAVDVTGVDVVKAMSLAPGAVFSLV